jgi:hypothetical protein
MYQKIRLHEMAKWCKVELMIPFQMIVCSIYIHNNGCMIDNHCTRIGSWIENIKDIWAYIKVRAKRYYILR